jgi:hypothetical protein
MTLTLKAVVAAGCLFTAAAASAQTRSTPTDFSGLMPTQTSVDVIADTGKTTRGRLLRFDADSLTIETGGREITFDRQHVERIYRRGDSLKNGMFTGLGIGAGLGIVAGVGADCGGLFGPVTSCSGREKLNRATVLGGILGAIGMGIGVGVDALFTGRQLVYDRGRRTIASIRVVPEIGRSGGGLAATLAW